MSTAAQIPPPPPGYSLDSAVPPPPPGYTLDSAPAGRQFAPPPGTPSISRPQINMQPESVQEALGGNDMEQMAGAAQQFAGKYAERVRSGMQSGADQLDNASETVANAMNVRTPHSATSLINNASAGLPNPEDYNTVQKAAVNLPADITSAALLDTENKAPNAVREGLSEISNVAKEPRADLAANRVAKLIKPMAGDLKYGAEPAAALPREGITGSTLEDLGEKVYARARDVGQTIDAVLQSPENAKKTVDVSKAVNQPLNEAIQNAVRAGDKTLYNKLQDLRQQVTNVWKEVTDEEGNKQLAPAAPRKLQMTPQEAVQLKRDIADMTRWNGLDPMENEINAVKARMFGGIKDVVNSAVPAVRELNQRYADLVNAGKAIERRAPVAARSADFSLGDIGTAVAGGVLTGQPGVGIAMTAARKVGNHPGVVTRVANALMPESLKYEEPAAIRARIPKEAPKAAPKPDSTVGAAQIQGTGGQPVVHGNAQDILSGLRKAGIRAGGPEEPITPEALAEQKAKLNQGYAKHGAGANYTKDDLAAFKRKHGIS